MSKILSEDCSPRADSILQSLRAFGYETATAIADIIDNSISANAKNIWIIYNWDKSSSWFAIMDDGTGMNEEELREAMRMGSKNPLEERDEKDLGRFGLGLKTASFSQCKQLTVQSKQQKNVFTRCWDLDYVNETKKWSLLTEPYSTSKDKLQLLDNVNDGTIVVWEKIDRIMENIGIDENEEAYNSFNEMIGRIDNYISMVFHRYIGIGGDISIYLCKADETQNKNKKIKAWDPFLKKHAATTEIPKEPISGNTDIMMTGYVLPHYTKMNEIERKDAEGMYGWNAHQGFYVYRNKRLIVPGTWLSTKYKKEDHYKLARIQIDVGNHHDSEWKIDVTKSEVIVPSNIKKSLLRYAKLVRKQALEVYNFRGKTIQRNANLNRQYIWKTKQLRNKTKYFIDKKHPVIKDIIHSIAGKSKFINQLLSLIQETIPLSTINVLNSEDPDSHIYDDTIDDFKSLDIKDRFLNLIRLRMSEGLSKEKAVSDALFTEPFSRIPELEMYADEVDNE